MQPAINPLAVLGLSEPTSDAQLDRIIDRLEAMNRRNPRNTHIDAAIAHIGERMRRQLATEVRLAKAA